MLTFSPAAFLAACPGAVAQGLIWGLLALGVYLTFKVLDFADLTVDSGLCTGGAVSAMLIMGGMNPLLSLLFATLAGMCAGGITGLLHTKLKIPAILSGILTQLALYSINMWIMGRANLTLLNAEVLLDMQHTGRSILVAGAVCTVIIGLLYWFFGTELGCSIRATGNNAHMSRALGVNTDTTKILCLMLSNGLVGLSGGLLAQYNGYADINMGRGAIVIGLAAVIIGEVILGKIPNFAMKMASSILGAIVYYIIITLVLQLRFPTTGLKLFSAVVVATALAISNLKKPKIKRLSATADAAPAAGKAV
ncbi:MAG: ABC transporter permease [Oscillospiraceae bacterium]